MPVVVHGEAHDLDQEVARQYQRGPLGEAQGHAVVLAEIGGVHIVVKEAVR